MLAGVMAADTDRLYGALLSRDPRFDGTFFVGVRSTGVYCRSICPAPRPKRQNCAFFKSAAAAEQAGYRPCKRCRPETAPGAPGWLGTEATVRRALCLLAQGAVRGGSVEALAGRLGVGARQLRRLFASHVGASPAAVARTQRVHVARQLLERTRLPVSQVSLAAGFGSLRRFNAALKSVYGAPPNALRGAGSGGVPGAPITLRLAYRPPYDWSAMVRFLAIRAVPGLESCVLEAYRRTIDTDGTAGSLEVAPEARDALAVRLELDRPTALLPVIGRIRAMFDLDADPSEIEAQLGVDAALAARVRRAPGLRVPGAWSPFELAVRAVIGQQVTLAAARTLLERLVTEHGEGLLAASARETPASRHRVFPRPERLAEADLTRIGLTRARAESVRRLAAAAARGELPLDGHADPDEAVRRLLDLPGIGRWTAGYIAMRALKHPDAFPSSDAGLVRAARALGIAHDAASLDRAAEAWRPWRAYAAMHLWHSLDERWLHDAATRREAVC
jgi:AraC family transcriptional regulator of adaptative response / DNA-3-methyladenine glycosylase II